MFYMKKNTHKKSHQKGFTLLETLVAVFILTLALTGPIYIASLAIRSSVESRDNVSAYYLAEEAIEVIRNRRDTRSLQNDISDATWLSDITGGELCTNANNPPSLTTCFMTHDSPGVYRFTQCPSGVCPALAFDPGGSVIYGGNTGAANSKFTREIYLQTAAQDGSTDLNGLANREVDLFVTVKWKDRGRNKQLKLVERLHNQQYAKYYIE